VTRVLGVDGGQSGIRLRHSSSDRTVEVPGVSHLEGDAVTAVAAYIGDGWREGAFEAIDRVVMGLTTAPSDRWDADRLCGLVGAVTGAPEVWVSDDTVIAHAGALSLGWGVLVLAGTGVACLSVPDLGEPRIIGGHGFLLGDEGGAFWIGRQGIRSVLRARDGRGAATSLVEAAERRFGDLADVHIRIHAAERPVNAIAQFAPDVLAAADAGDAVAVTILDEATEELRRLAQAGAAWAGTAGRAVPLALGGRLLAPGSALRDRLDTRLRDDAVTLTPRIADASPLDGALLLGAADDPGQYLGLVHVWHQGRPG
jgi:glucosamine kinase